jgi:hypothetical protein
MNQLLINPFAKYSENKLFAIGIIGNLFLIALSFVLNTLLAGNLKIVYLNKISFNSALFSNGIIIAITTIGIYILGYVINKKTRFIDILNTVLISRCVMVLFPLLNINNLFYVLSERIKNTLIVANPAKILSSDLYILLLLCVPIIITLIWFFILFFNGFKIATNAKGSKVVVQFAGTFIIIEIITRLLILNFL